MAKNLVVRFIGDASALDATLGGVQAKMRTALGPKGLVAAGVVGAAAAGLAAIGSEFDKAYDKIRVGTGATGDALEGLKDDFKDVVSDVPADFGDASTAIADVNTRLGLTGDPLQTVAAQFLELSRITGTDVATNIEKATRVFGDWGVATEDQEGALDALFRASQSSGVTVDQLADKVVQFGAPLRNLGFDLDEATGLIASFEKNGVNLETVMGGLRQGIGRLAKAGEDVPDTFRRVVGEIENAEDASEATRLAIELFGQRAGPDLADAIQNGQFAVEEMVAAIADGSDTIRGAGKETMSMGEQFELVKNRVFVALEPIASDLFKVIGDVAEVVGMLAQAFSSLPGPVRTAALAIGGLLLLLNLNPTFAVITAIVGAATLITKNWGTIAEFFEDVWEAVQDAFDAVLGFFEDWWPVLLGIFTGGIGLVVALIVENRDKIVQFFKELPGKVTGALGDIGRTIWNAIQAGFEFLVGAVEFVVQRWIDVYIRLPLRAVEAIGDLGRTIWDAIAGGMDWLFDKVAGLADQVVFIIASIPGRLLQGLYNMGSVARSLGGALFDGIVGALNTVGDALWDIIRGAINRIIGAWNRLDVGIHVSIPGWVPVVGGKTFGIDDIFPDIGYLAHGGVTQGFTLAALGDNPSGEEAVIPLDDPRATRRIGDALGAGPTTIVVQVGDRELGRWMLDELNRTGRRNGTVQIRAGVAGVT